MKTIKLAGLNACVFVYHAEEADKLFRILMGEDVEKRRDFIRTHALEVQNLDV